MMNKYEYIKQIFLVNENKKNAISMENYMRNKFQFYGISSQLRKQLYKQFLTNEKKTKIIDWDFLDECYDDEHREFQYFVLDYLIKFDKYLKYEDISKIEKYVKEKQWWDTIDIFDKIIGNIGLNDPKVDDLMLKWSTSNDIWLRRIAIDHQNGRKEKTNTKLLETIIINNLGTHEFFY